MISRSDRASICEAYAENLESFLHALAVAEDANAEEWDEVVAQVQRLYSELGKHVERLENPF